MGADMAIIWSVKFDFFLPSFHQYVADTQTKQLIGFSFEYPQHIFCLRNKQLENYLTLCMQESLKGTFTNSEDPDEMRNYFTLCIQETPKWVLLQTVKTQMKCHI